MTLIFYLYLVHFLADYSLQPSCLVKYKANHFLGVVIHSTVHLLTLLVVLVPFLPNSRVWIVIGIIYITHIIIDQTKVMLNKAHPQYIRFFYFLDQIVHLVVITACAWYAGVLSPGRLSGTALTLYSEPTVILYLLLLVLATYVCDVTCYFVKRGYKKGPFRRNYRNMLLNAGLVTVAFGIYWLVY